MKCKYRFKNEGCEREAISGKAFCILHEKHENKSPEETMKEFYKDIERGKTSFKGCNLFEIDLCNKNIEGLLSFNDTKIDGGIIMHGAMLEGIVLRNSVVKGGICAENIKIQRGGLEISDTTVHSLYSYYAQIDGAIIFYKSQIEDFIFFKDASINSVHILDFIVGGSIYLDGTTMNDSIYLFKMNAGEHIFFRDGSVLKDLMLGSLTIDGEISVYGTKFQLAETQEELCRIGKIAQEKSGNRELADYHYYKEMEAQRKQKKFFIRNLEKIWQYPLGYGVYPMRIFVSWIIIILLFALIYWYLAESNNIWDLYHKEIQTFQEIKDLMSSFMPYFYDSFSIAMIQNFESQANVIAMVEIIIGKFMEAVFVVTFARKYMR